MSRLPVRWGAVPWLAITASSFAAVTATGALGAPRDYALLREGVNGGELFRLWTGHFTHFNGAHLLGDLLAFAVWAALVETESRRLLAFTLLAGAPALSLALLASCPDLAQYRGLSALDCALVSELLLLRGLGLDIGGARRAPTLLLARLVGGTTARIVALVGAAAFFLKCAYEFDSGQALLAPDLGPGVRLLPLSHSLGSALGAFAVGLLCAMTIPRVADRSAG